MVAKGWTNQRCLEISLQMGRNVDLFCREVLVNLKRTGVCSARMISIPAAVEVLEATNGVEVEVN